MLPAERCPKCTHTWMYYDYLSHRYVCPRCKEEPAKKHICVRCKAITRLNLNGTWLCLSCIEDKEKAMFNQPEAEQGIMEYDDLESSISDTLSYFEVEDTDDIPLLEAKRAVKAMELMLQCQAEWIAKNR